MGAIHVKHASLDKMSARSLGATVARLFAHAKLNRNEVRGGVICLQGHTNAAMNYLV